MPPSFSRLSFSSSSRRSRLRRFALGGLPITRHCKIGSSSIGDYDEPTDIDRGRGRCGRFSRVQNPLTSLHDASQAARRAIAAQPGPTVLVGHSFSGMIVSDVGLDPKIAALVYVAARAPDAGEDYTALAKNYPTPPATAGIVFNDDWGLLTEEAFLHDFAGDLPPEQARVLYAVQQPFHKALLTGKTTHAAWRSKPSYYAVSTDDRTINPDLERFMAKRMGAKTIEVKASHLSLISHPDEISRLILEAAGQQA
jgi:pimeloyl-ACP methyl ester carboxylesterase